MRFEKIEIEYRKTDGFSPTTMDGIRHVKSLPFLSVVQAVVGNYDIQIGDGEMHNTGVGGFFIAPADVQQTIVHHSDPALGKMVSRWAFIRIRVNDHWLLDELYDFPAVLPEEYKGEMNAVFERLFSTDSLLEEYSCYYTIADILLRSAREKTRTIPPYLSDVLHYIQRNYKEKICVDMLAKVAHMSSSRFAAVFKKEIGVSPIAYLNNYRLSVAAELLSDSRKKLTEIAGSVGIADPVYFNKMFRKAYRLSPGRYREVYTGEPARPDKSADNDKKPEDDYELFCF